MAPVSSRATGRKIDYPTSDGRPMAETDDHRDLMLDLIETLKYDRADDPEFYVSGNLLIYYVPNNRRKHVAPDVFAVRGIPKHNRPYYLTWVEGKNPEAAIELTSNSTKSEDIKRKFVLYRDVLRVQEYFLFDPHLDYLKPPLQGFRLWRGDYRRIRPVKGKLPSQVLGVHLERDGKTLRLYDPARDRWLPTPREVREQAEAAQRLAEAAQMQTLSENERLRWEVEELRRRLDTQR